jgi:hypothetical protein
MKRTLLSLALLAGLAGASPSLLAQPSEALSAQVAGMVAPSPAAQVEELARLFRAGDLTGLAQAMVPPSKWEEMRTAYELARLEPVTDEDRARFEEKFERITAPDAVDRLMAEIEPKLAEARPQAPGALLMAFGAMQVAIASPDSDLTDDQRAALQAAFPGIQRWAGNTDFLSSVVMRDALTLVTDAARRTGITDIDQLKSLPLEAALDRAGTVFAAAKDAVRLYGIDLDAIADSLQVEVLDLDGDSARVRTTVIVFDAPISLDHDLVLVEGRWYGKDAIVHVHDGDIDMDVEIDS